jgi:beta-xylosidase
VLLISQGSCASRQTTHDPSRGPAEGALDGDFADPFILPGGDAYHAFATGAGRYHLQIARSRDLAAWTHLGEALPELPAWAAKAEGLTWAPSALMRNGWYILYYTTRDALSGFQCISRAQARRPEGPYVDDSTQPLVCQVSGDASFCGSIDPSPFLDADGKPYLLWKSDENSGACRTAPRIWAQGLTDDGLSLTGSPKVLLAMDQNWEGLIIEAPSMVVHGGRHFLFYSANRYESGDYAIGYATCASPSEPCTKATIEAPFAKSEASTLGPGGQELFNDESGAIWMAYHAWTAPMTNYAGGGARTLRLTRMTFAPDGRPETMTLP